ncbi:MAG: serine hydrolase domain-containing protein [Pseudomonadota bacterium]
MKLRRYALAVAAMFAPFGAVTASEERAASVVESWRTWAHGLDIEAGEIAVLMKGEPLAETSFGGAGGPADLASLSKAITATCLARLVGAGEAAWDDRVGDHLPEAQPPLADATLAGLMTHSAGVNPDETQGWMPELRGAGETAYAETVDRIGDRPLQAAGRYAYNNENYGVLAAVIEEVAGASYEEACAQPGLSPSPTYGRFAAWGGWRGELSDYGRFHWRAFGGFDASEAPSVPAFGPEVLYGLGTIQRAFGGGWNFWHFGALCFADGDRFMTHAVLFSDGLGVVSRVEGCPEEDWFGSLDAAIVRGAFARAD